MTTVTKTDLSALNDRQREAVISDEKRLLVLAGAGSGKTKTLLQKLIYLIEEKDVDSKLTPPQRHSQRTLRFEAEIF
jgi:DNA helicase IV